MVGEGERGHFEFFCARDEGVEFADPVEEGVVRVSVKMNEGDRSRRGRLSKSRAGGVLLGRLRVRVADAGGFFFEIVLFLFFKFFDKTV